MSTATTHAPAVDPTRLEQLLGGAVVDAGATMAAGLVVIGARLGLYTALAEGPLTTGELATRTGTNERYVREWACAQAAGGYLTYHADGDRFGLSPEQALALDPDGPVDLTAMFRLSVNVLRDVDVLETRMRTGAGFGWDEQDEDVTGATAEFYSAGYRAHLLTEWIPALDGVADKLAKGARVADIGCGYGVTTVMLAHAFPASTFHGFDYHGASIDHARAAAEKDGIADRVTFEVSDASDVPALGYDFVCTFDALHDYGDPLAAARRVRETLVPGGSWMIVEPRAGASLIDNLNPVGRMFYSGSTYMCVPTALAQGGSALGAQAGEAALREILIAAGFSDIQVAVETPINFVLHARP